MEPLGYLLLAYCCAGLVVLLQLYSWEELREDLLRMLTALVVFVVTWSLLLWWPVLLGWKLYQLAYRKWRWAWLIWVVYYVKRTFTATYRLDYPRLVAEGLLYNRPGWRTETKATPDWRRVRDIQANAVRWNRRRFRRTGKR